MDSRDGLVVLLKEKYEHEIRRRSYFDGALSTPITLLTTLVGGIYFAINDKALANYTILTYIKYVLVFALIATIIIAFIFLYGVYFRFRELYSSFPDSKLVSDYYKNLKNHYQEYSNGNSEEDINSKLKDQTIEWYVDTNTCNTNINDKRGDAFYKARIALGIALSLGIVLFLLICLSKINPMSNNNKKPEKQPEPKQKPLPSPPIIRQEKAQEPKVEIK